MRRSIAIAATAVFLLTVVLAVSPARAQDAGKATTARSWTGWITDEACGAANANADGKACALRCAKSGSKLVLYVDGEKSLLQLDNQELAMKHLGHPVMVTGTLENGVIKVQTIEEKKG